MSAKEEESYPLIQSIARELVARTGRATSVDVRRLMGEKRFETSQIYRAMCRCEELTPDFKADSMYIPFVPKDKVAQ
jgi:hypothetical protein